MRDNSHSVRGFAMKGCRHAQGSSHAAIGCYLHFTNTDQFGGSHGRQQRVNGLPGWRTGRAFCAPQRQQQLASERAAVMPSLDDALQRFLDERVAAGESQASPDENVRLRSSQRAAGA